MNEHAQAARCTLERRNLGVGLDDGDQAGFDASQLGASQVGEQREGVGHNNEKLERGECVDVL